jgi:site-specific DNA-adenine methylase
MRENLQDFIKKLQSTDIELICKDFRDVCITEIQTQDFVYADPPYNKTTATYNERGGWTDVDDRDLFNLLDSLTSRGIKFALSNLYKNPTLIEWAQKYKVHFLRHNYKNCNYQKKDRSGSEQEVLITNY